MLHYWELTTLPLLFSRFVGIGGIFLICFCRRHAKRAKHQILSEWDFLSVKGRIILNTFFVCLFLFRKVLATSVLTNQCCFVRHSFTTGLSWWNDFHFVFCRFTFPLIYFDRIYILLAFWTRRRSRSFLYFFSSKKLHFKKVSSIKVISLSVWVLF